ncbi:MAG TPA: DUF434 domain-containing protein [Pyrinomonadaceae bacterium]|nr:DUF434 domain-containing protein [Pyrinomonadaceae bacterium]
MSPDLRKHRGAHPEDRKLFAEDQLPKLRAAVGELSWLLTHDYMMKGASKLVGDKFALTERQRLAMSRAACSDQSKAHRASTRVAIDELKDQQIIIDGFNLLITIEAALSGGVLMLGRDGCVRDLSSVHGSYRSVDETNRAIELIGATLDELGAGSVSWILDKPISNSGRLAQRLRNAAAEHESDWSVEIAFNPDAEIVAAGGLAISSDGPLLDRVGRWTNLARHLVEKRVADAWLIDLS